MSTQRFMARICKSPGHFTLAMLLGALLALPCLLPAAVFARAREQAGALSILSAPDASAPSSVLTRSGVSVVRLLAVYGSPNDRQQVTCTGLGVLVGSQSTAGTTRAYTNWVLTDGNLVTTQMTICGKPAGLLPLSSLEVWASNEYTGGSTIMLGSMTCKGEPVACTDGLSTTVSDALILPPVVTSTSYTLFSFQSTAEEPFVGLSSSADTTTIVNVGLTNPAITKGSPVYPYKDVNGENSPAANYKDYLTPASVADPPASSNGLPGQVIQANNNTIEGGTPAIDGPGELVGIWVNNSSTGGYTTVPATVFQLVLPEHGVSVVSTATPSVQNCTTVASCWDAGIGAYNATNYAQAHTGLSKASALNPQFIAAQKYDTLAQQHLSGGNAKDKGSNTVSIPATSGILEQYPWLELAGLALLVLILALLIALLIRARNRRRELAMIANEWQIGRKAAEQEALQKQAQVAAAPQGPQISPSPVPLMFCPNCHNPVYQTDSICPNCRFPLSPSASGLGIRLAGNAPVNSAPLPPPPPSISEQPTVQMLPNSPIPPAAYSEPTMPRAQFQAPDQPPPFVQQVRGRNLSLAVGTRTDPGIKRKHKPNEDSMFAFQWDRTHNSQHQQFGLFVVADGMGGHANGQDASRLAIQTMIDFMLPQVISGESRNDEELLKLMENGVQASNQAVHGRNMESHADMGTTMTAALVMGAMAYVANVGDSRTYLYREGQGLSKVTHDHSVVASLVDAGIIKPDDVYTHPKRNQIYRSLGEKPVVEVDTFPVNLLPGDKLLLCSDGLWDMVRDPLIQDVLGKTTGDPNETGKNLIKAALNGGGEDNVSVIVVQFAEINERTGMTGVQLLAKPESVTVPNLPPL